MLDIEVSAYPGEQDWRSVIDREDLKLHMRLLHDALNPEIEQAIKSAISYLDGVGGVLNRAVQPYTFVRYLPAFPESGIIRLPYPPLRSITSVSYLDTSGATVVLASSNYVVKNHPEVPAEIEFLDVDALPDTYEHPRAVFVTFIAGYGSGAGQQPIPEALRRAVKLLAAHYMENPEATINESKVVTINRKIDFGLDHLLARLKVPHEYGDWT